MIKEILLKYKSITEAIIVNIKNDLDVDKLMEKREKLLKLLIEDIKLDKEEMKETYLELKLDNLDNMLKDELNKALEKNKEALRKIKNQRNANIAYGKNMNTISFFNKKI